MLCKWIGSSRIRVSGRRAGGGWGGWGGVVSINSALGQWLLTVAQHAEVESCRVVLRRFFGDSVVWRGNPEEGEEEGGEGGGRILVKVIRLGFILYLRFFFFSLF